MSGWSDSLKASLADTSRRARFRLERRALRSEPGADYSIATDPDAGASAVLALDRTSVRVAGQTLYPRGWTTTIGGWSVTVVSTSPGGTGALTELLAHWTRGTVVALMLGFDGTVDTQFEQIALGQIVNLTRAGVNRWTLTCRDLYGALTQRLTTSATETALFLSLSSTTLTADYATGDTTLNVASTTGFERETSGTGAVLVTPAAGDAFFLRWTASTGTTLTVAAADVGGTVRVAASTGDTVQEVVRVSGHPIDIVRKVLSSTGAGTAGGYDTLPEYWGLGIEESNFADEDMRRWKEDVADVSSGSYTWEVLEVESVPDAFAWLSALLATSGFFFAIYQGRLTVRCAQQTTATTGTQNYFSTIEITDDDIIEVESYEAWDAGHPVEYSTITVRTASASTSSTTGGVMTLPVESQLDYDLSGVVFENDTEMVAEAANRLHEDAQRIPERVVVRCASLRLAELCIGDVPTLTTTRCPSRALGDEGFSRRRVLVDLVEPDYVGGTVRVGMLVYPTADEEVDTP